MAIGIHVVQVRFIGVNPMTNQVVDKSKASTALSDVLYTSHEHRVIVDSNVPNTSTQPTVKRYLELEAADGYKLQHMDQNTIITYEV